MKEMEEMEEMEKISFYGLSRSGKSCYIFAMAHALSQGIKLSNKETLTVRTPYPRQILRIQNAYSKMEQGLWPKGNIESFDYNFNVRKSTELLTKFGLTDFRGGLLDSMDEEDEKEQEKLLSSYEDSSVLLFFVGADVVMSAIKGDPGDNFKVDYFNTLYEDYLTRTGDAKTPIMVVITKSDMLSSQEVIKAKDFMKDKLMSLFARWTNITAAITAVTLGRNLSNQNGELEGELIIGPTAGNIHIPILFSLFCIMSKKLEESYSTLQDAEEALGDANHALANELKRSSFARFFNNREKSIRDRIVLKRSVIDDEKKKLDDVALTLDLIKPLLTEGAEIYINGIKM